MYDEIIRRIAQENGINADEVRTEMERAIAEAYRSPSPEALNVPRNGDIPTVEELLSHAIEKVRLF